MTFRAPPCSTCVFNGVISLSINDVNNMLCRAKHHMMAVKHHMMAVKHHMMAVKHHMMAVKHHMMAVKHHMMAVKLQSSSFICRLFKNSISVGRCVK